MPIDTSIYSQIRAPEQINPLAQYAQVAQIKNLQNQARLADLAYGEKEREVAGNRQISEAYRRALGTEGKLDRGVLERYIAEQGEGARIPGIRKSLLETEEAQGKVDKQKTDLIDAKLKQSRNYLENVTTPEQYLAWHEGNHQDPILGPALAARGVTADKARASVVEALSKPGGFEELLNKSRVGIEKFTEMNKPTFQTRNLGGTTETLQIPGMGGTPQTISSMRNTQSPESIANVGASYANAAATRAVAEATRAAAGMQRDRETEMKLGDDYRKQSKNFQEIGEAYRLINSTLDKATTSPAATLASATKFMKLLDPGSVVRESELGMALAASGVFDRAANYYETLKRGKILTQQQVTDFKNITQQIYGAAQTGQKQIDLNYINQAKNYGLRPEMVVQDLGQNEPLAPAAAALPKGWTVKAK